MTKKIAPNYIRTPAVLISLERRQLTQKTSFDRLVQSLTKNFPHLSQELGELQQTATTELSTIDQQHGALVLKGHGVRGSNASYALVTSKDNDAFIKKLPVKADVPVDPADLFRAFRMHFMIDLIDQDQKAWVMPDEKMFGLLVKDGSKAIDQDLMDMAEGIYVIQTDKQSSYTVKIDLEDGVLIFTPTSGPYMVTYCELEATWVPHTAWDYVSGPQVLARIDAFFAKTHVRDVSVKELKALDLQVRALPRGRIETLGQFTDDTATDLVLPLNDLFALWFPAEGEPAIRSVRDDLPWSELSFFTRRHLFSELAAKVKALSATPKKTTKKTAKDKA